MDLMEIRRRMLIGQKADKNLFNKNFTKKGAANAPFVFTTPSTCEYIRLQYGLADLNVDSIRIVPYTS